MDKGFADTVCNNSGVKQYHAGVYAIRNTQTGKCYIGSSVNMYVRFSQHRNALRKGTHCNPKLQHAWNKYGEGSFELQILEHVYDSSQLIIREQALLDGCKSRYNIAIQCCEQPMLGRQHSAETKAKMSASNRGKPGRTGQTNSPEHNAKIGAANAVANLGKAQSAETKEKRAAKLRGRTRNPAIYNEDWRRKQSLAHANQVCSTQARKNLSAALRGKPKSEAHRLAQSAAMKATWARKRLATTPGHT